MPTYHLRVRTTVSVPDILAAVQHLPASTGVGLSDAVHQDAVNQLVRVVNPLAA